MTIMTLQEAADYLKISKTFLAKLCRLNKVPHVRMGRRYIFTQETLNEWLQKEMKGEMKIG